MNQHPDLGAPDTNYLMEHSLRQAEEKFRQAPATGYVESPYKVIRVHVVRNGDHILGCFAQRQHAVEYRQDVGEGYIEEVDAVLYPDGKRVNLVTWDPMPHEFVYTYETTATRDEQTRREALAKLTHDERRVLGLV